MIYQIDRVLRDVRVALDQNMESEALIAIDDVDTLSLDEIIRSKIEESAQEVELMAPTAMLDHGDVFGDEGIEWRDGELGVGRLILPPDFMRFIAFRMSDWERTVYEAIDERSAKYSRQSSRLKGIRGTSQKPVCAIVPGNEGLHLEIYGSKDNNATIATALYMPRPVIEEYVLAGGEIYTGAEWETAKTDLDEAIVALAKRFEGIDVSERLYRAVVYETASATALTLADAAKADKLSAKAASLMGVARE